MATINVEVDAGAASAAMARFADALGRLALFLHGLSGQFVVGTLSINAGLTPRLTRFIVALEALRLDLGDLRLFAAHAIE